MFKTTIIIAALALSACATRGTKIEQSNVDAIAIGKTSKTEMLATFGKPLSQSYGSEGKMSMTWFYVRVGPFGTGMQNQNLIVLFDQKDKVEKFSLIDGTK